MCSVNTGGGFNFTGKEQIKEIILDGIKIIGIFDYIIKPYNLKIWLN